MRAIDPCGVRKRFLGQAGLLATLTHSGTQPRQPPLDVLLT
jgi:hypothetical protein